MLTTLCEPLWRRQNSSVLQPLVPRRWSVLTIEPSTHHTRMPRITRCTLTVLFDQTAFAVRFRLPNFPGPANNERLAGYCQCHPLSHLELVGLKVFQVGPNNMTDSSSGTLFTSLLASIFDATDSMRASSAMISLLVPLCCLSLMSHSRAALILPSDNLPSPSPTLLPALPTVLASVSNGTFREVRNWPAPSTRYPLFNYDDGFLMFRDYGVDGNTVRLFPRISYYLLFLQVF